MAQLGRRSPAWRFMGLETVEAGEGQVVVTMPTRPDHANHQGTVHGGFIGMLADSAMGRALSTAVPEGSRHFSFDLKLTFINWARPGELLRCTGRVLHLGRRTGVCEARVAGEDGRLVATATASFSISAPGKA